MVIFRGHKIGLKMWKKVIMSIASAKSGKTECAYSFPQSVHKNAFLVIVLGVKNNVFHGCLLGSTRLM